MEKIVKVLVAANLFLSIAVIAVAISFISHVKSDGGHGQPALAENQAKPAAQTELSELSKATAETASLKSVDITLSDDKIEPLGFSVYTDEKVELNITNNSNIELDLKITALDLESGIIRPRETKKVSLGILPQEEKSYEYKTAASDGSQEYTGTLIVLVKK